MIKRKSKIIRKKKPSIIVRKKKINPPIIRNLGGFVSNVGDGCLRKEKRIKDYNTIWIDCGICHSCPDKPCKYFKAWKENLKND